MTEQHLKAWLLTKHGNRFLGSNAYKHRKYAKDQHKLQVTKIAFYEDFKLQCKRIEMYYVVCITHQVKDLVAITVRNHPQRFYMVVCLI